MARDLLTVGELASESGLSRATLYRVIGAGDLAVVRLSPGPGQTRRSRGAIRIQRCDWEAYLARHRVPATQEHAVPLRQIAGTVRDLPGFDRYLK